MTDMPDRLHETVLVLRCQAGDVAAFEEIVARYGPRLNYYLLKLLGRPAAVEDAAQEVWLDVHRALPRLRQPEAFRAWLYRIARDRAARMLRVPQTHVRLTDTENVAAVATEDVAFTADDADRIHRALDRLSTEHRDVLVLRFIEDLSYEEISEITGCTLGTVKSRIHYAKRLLRRQLEGLSVHE
jgi:RNA polymerase sigma-70 factor (ECF subfamily)